MRIAKVCRLFRAKVLAAGLAAVALYQTSSPLYAAGTLNIALQQQFSFTGCSTAANVCGTPLSGGLLYFYQAGTASTRQDSFQDTALSTANPWPLVLDANGRIPMFYLADGSIHVRLTDAGGVVQFDIPSLLVVGPSGGGGGGAGIDATAIASTGDIKFRMTGETLLNWVKLNGQKIGNTGSAGADLTGAQYQNLYNYLWVNCTNAHCAVAGGRGGTANADWNAGKNLQLPDWRGRAPFGLDDMGNSRANRLVDGNNAFTAGDTGITPGGTGGESQHTQLAAEMFAHRHGGLISDPGHAHAVNDPTHVHGLVDPGHAHTINDAGHAHNFAYENVAVAGGLGGSTVAGGHALVGGTTSTNATGISVNGSLTGVTVAAGPTGISILANGTGVFFQDGAGNVNATTQVGSSSPFNNMQPFILGSWYVRL